MQVSLQVGWYVGGLVGRYVGRHVGSLTDRGLKKMCLQILFLTQLPTQRCYSILYKQYYFNQSWKKIQTDNIFDIFLYLCVSLDITNSVWSTDPKQAGLLEQSFSAENTKYYWNISGMYFLVFLFCNYLILNILNQVI